MTDTTRILDVGCGSGILGMLALKFGAAYAVGTDLDPCAIDATHENMKENGVPKEQYEVMIGNIIDDKAIQDQVGYACYDIVAANILADVLVMLTPVIVSQLKQVAFTLRVESSRQGRSCKTGGSRCWPGAFRCDLPGRVGLCYGQKSE